MRVVGLLPAVSLSCGVALGLVAPWSHVFAWTLACAAAVAAVGWLGRRSYVTTGALVLGFVSGGAAAASEARAAALHPPLRQVLHDAFGGFAIDTPGPGGPHDPLPMRAVVLRTPRSAPASSASAWRSATCGSGTAGMRPPALLP